ncbi:MAG: Spy/CpxP family protein refolding chaperone [Nitrospirae bacterium]|nr:Spy/CpxP family protein refolding chaperone [Nitrospirota bacterium]
MKDFLLIFLLLMVIILLASRFIGVRRKPIRGYLDLINISEGQKQQVEDIRRDFLPRVAGIRQALRQNRLELNDLLFADPPDMRAIEGKSRDISKLQTQLEREVIDHILQEKELLSPEQKRQFYDVIRTEFEKGGLGVHGEQRPGTTRNAGEGR